MSADTSFDGESRHAKASMDDITDAAHEAIDQSRDLREPFVLVQQKGDHMVIITNIQHCEDIPQLLTLASSQVGEKLGT